jgi:UDP-GlcNAc:undecaprenyl-phosphate GlcNAc-1-phosphate transferase
VTEITWFVLPGVAAAVITLALTPAIARLAVRVGAVDIPDGRKVHRRPVPRMGGLAVVTSIATVLAWAPLLSAGRWQLPPHLAESIGWGMLPILLISIADDIRSVRPRYKLLAHVLGAVIAVILGIALGPAVHIFGSEVYIGWTAGPLSVLWIVGVTNAFNLIDGLDGLSAGLAMIAAVSMALVFVLVGQPGMSGAALVLAGAILGFLPYNLHPARLFLGDTGSTAIGFCLAAFALRGGSTLSSGFAALLPVFILGLPIADMLIAMTRRTLRRLEHHVGSVFEADRNHIHHRLLAMGIEHHTAVLTLYGAGLVLAGSALMSLLFSEREAALMVVALLFAGLVGVQRLGYDEFAFIRRGTVLKVYELRPVKRGFFIVFVDLAITFAAVYLAIVLKTDVWSLKVAGPQVLEMATALAPVTVAVFSRCGMYRGSWRVAGLQDLTKIVVAIAIATPLGALVLSWISSNGYPASIFGIYAALSLLLTASVRASYVVLEQTVLRSTRRGEPVLIYGAGRRGVGAVNELLQNQTLNLWPVGFIDDDPDKRGRIISGLTVLGAVRDLERTLAATRVTGILISSDKIAPHRLDRATDVCRKKKATLLHLDIGVHRMDGAESPLPAAAPAVHPRPAAVTFKSILPRHAGAQPCASCKSFNVHRSKARSTFERFKKLRTDKRLYRCEDCGWRGWLTPLEFGAGVGAAAGGSFDPRLAGMAGHTGSPFARPGNSFRD